MSPWSFTSSRTAAGPGAPRVTLQPAKPVDAHAHQRDVLRTRPRRPAKRRAAFAKMREATARGTA